MSVKRTTEVEDYRMSLLQLVCTKKRVIAIYGGDDPEMKEIAREANQLTRLPLEDRHRILRFIIVKPLNLETWK